MDPQTEETPESPETETETPETPEGETPEGGKPAPEPNLTRAERRAAFKQLREDNQRIQSELSQERDRRAAMEASVAEMRGYLQAHSQREQQSRANETDQRIAQLEQEANQRLVDAAGSKDPTIQARHMSEYYRLIREAAKVDVKRDLSGDFQRMQNAIPNQEMMAHQARMTAEFPWMGLNPKTNQPNAATALAAEIEEQMINDGKPANWTTTRAALAQAQARLGIGGQSPPTASQRGAYTGIPSREGAGNDSKLQLHPANLSDWQKKLAEKSHPELESAEAHKAWVKLMNASFSKESR